MSKRFLILLALSVAVFLPVVSMAGEDWPQYKFDSRHSGNAPDRSVSPSLGLIGAVPLTDAIFTAPAVSEGRVYIVDGSGVAFCIDAETMTVLWTFKSRGGEANCSNVSSPAVAGNYLHFGTMAGTYYVLNKTTGSTVKEIECGEPIFSAPVVSQGRVYFATLGSNVYALEPNGTVCWTWDFVKEALKFEGDRWSGADWLKHKKGRVTWQDQFCCVRNIAADGKRLVIPAGGALVWLEDSGDSPNVLNLYKQNDKRRESPATLGLTIGENGAVYRQWHRRDNRGAVDVMRLHNGEVEKREVPGTLTWDNLPWSLSFCSVSVRGDDVYRCRPEENFGLCKHSPEKETHSLGGYPSIAPPVLLRDHAVYGSLDGCLNIVPLSESGEVQSFKTAFGKAITAPVAVCDGRVYFGCEDGYLYAFGPNGRVPLPTKDLQLHRIRSPLTGTRTASKYNRFTSFSDLANTNANDQGLEPPFDITWIRRYKGTVKHFSVCGDGRLYTHTAEGQIFAVEQETGRMLWRRYWPGVHISFTSPIFHQGRLLVPQAGLEKSILRCLDAATGDLLWETPFSGSPSWNRQMPPIVYKNLAIYPFSTGKFTGKNWLFEHQSTFGFPKDHKPLVRAWNLETGDEVWTQEFSEFGSGGDDGGLCLMDGTLYYSCYFGDSANKRRGFADAKGVTAALKPETGEILWSTNQYCVHAGCTVTGEKGRLYLGGYNPVEGKINRVWCLDARDGSLIWKSEQVKRAIHAVTIGKRFLFTHAQYEDSYLLDKETGKIVATMSENYSCTRFNISEPYLIGSNMDLYDLSNDVKMVSTGPQVDVLECVGAFASNGRLFYTANGGGVQVSAVTGQETQTIHPPWEKK